MFERIKSGKRNLNRLLVSNNNTAFLETAKIVFGHSHATSLGDNPSKT